MKKKVIRKDRYGNKVEVEVEETDRERKERLMPGSDELTKLSKGITEDEREPTLKSRLTLAPFNTEEEAQDWLKTIEVDDGDEDEDCALDYVPENWGRLMSKSETTRALFKKRLEESKRKRKRKLMKHCNKEGGNPYHSGKDGKFVSRDDAKSWSIRMGKTSPDCKAGLARMQGGRELFHKRAMECGREGDYLCGEPDTKKSSKGRLKTESDDCALTTRAVKSFTSAFARAQDETQGEFASRLKSVLDALINPYQWHPGMIAEGEGSLTGMNREQVVALCNKHGLRTLQQLLTLINSIQSAAKGSLDKPSG